MIDKQIFSFSLRRSGHTAILAWIAGMHEPTFMFGDVHCRAKKIKAPAILEFRHGTKVNIKNYSPKLKFDGLRLASVLANSDYKMVICSFEDMKYNDFSANKINTIVHKFKIVPNDMVFVIVVLRDPFNLFASRLSYEGLDTTNNRATKYYKMQIDYCIDGYDTIMFNLLCINYNKWIASKLYRMRIANRLGLQFSDRRLNEVISENRFDDDIDGIRTNHTNRWKHFVNTTKFHNLVDNELIESAEKMFDLEKIKHEMGKVRTNM